MLCEVICVSSFLWVVHGCSHFEKVQSNSLEAALSLHLLLLRISSSLSPLESCSWEKLHIRSFVTILWRTLLKWHICFTQISFYSVSWGRQFILLNNKKWWQERIFFLAFILVFIVIIITLIFSSQYFHIHFLPVKQCHFLISCHHLCICKEEIVRKTLKWTVITNLLVFESELPSEFDDLVMAANVKC